MTSGKKPFVAWGVLLVLAVAMNHGPPARAADTDAQIKRLYDEAGAARKAGELAKAATLLEELYELKSSAIILNNLGRLYAQLGWYDKAVKAYRKVADDTKADMKLRALDTTRLTALKPKLGRAWLKVGISPAGSRLWVDGKAPLRWQADEIGVAPGERVLEMRELEDTIAHLMVVTLPTDRRTTMDVDLTKLATGSRGSISLIGDREALTDLRINGVPLAHPLARLATITLPAGKAALELVFPGDKRVSQELDIQPGKLSPLKITAPKLLPQAPVGTAPVVETESNLLSWILIGVGTAAAGAGGGLLIDGNMSGSELNEALANQSPVTSFSQQEAHEIRNRANLEGTVGLAILSVGTAALITGTILYLIRPTRQETVIKQVEAPLSVTPGLDGSVQVRLLF